MKRMFEAAVLASALGATVSAALGVTLRAQQTFTSPGDPPPPVPMPAILKAYAAVTTERLRRPDPGDWLMLRGTYDGWGYSPLDQITPLNANRLQPVWVFATGATSGHEAPAL